MYIDNTQKAEQMIDEINAGWRCKHGLIHTNPVGPDKEPSTLNGAIYTGIVVGMLESAILRYFIMKTSKIEEFLKSCDAAMQTLHQDKYPMICRTMTNTDQQGPDDYKGYVTFCNFRRRKYQITDLLEYSEVSHKTLKGLISFKAFRWLNNSRDNERIYDIDLDSPWYYKIIYRLVSPANLKPWIAPWMGRFPALIWQMEATVNRKSPLWRVLWTGFSLAEQAFFGNKKKPDRWYMDWNIVATNRHSTVKSRTLTFLSKLWLKKLYKLYPNGMKQVWADYTVQHNSSFPLAKFFIE